MKCVGADGAEEIAYTRKPKNGRLGEEEHLDALDFLARLIVPTPEPRLHLAHYYGHYSNVSRGRRRESSLSQSLAEPPNSRLTHLQPGRNSYVALPERRRQQKATSTLPWDESVGRARPGQA